MRFNIYKPSSGDKLSLKELDLYHLLMDFRHDHGLESIPLSKGLSATAGRHAADTFYNIWASGLALPQGANLHSWSDVPYFEDHRTPWAMWYAPERIGTGYDSEGYEISTTGYLDSPPQSPLEGWKSSPAHKAVILNSGAWSALSWGAIGIGIESHRVGDPYTAICHVWFGEKADQAAPPPIRGTRLDDRIEGTRFADLIQAESGDDSIRGAGGEDRLIAGAGSDRLSGGPGRDRLTGAAAPTRSAWMRRGAAMPTLTRSPTSSPIRAIGWRWHDPCSGLCRQAAASGGRPFTRAQISRPGVSAFSSIRSRERCRTTATATSQVVSQPSWPASATNPASPTT